jgi:hypothetical protein
MGAVTCVIFSYSLSDLLSLVHPYIRMHGVKPHFLSVEYGDRTGMIAVNQWVARVLCQ